jgi:hypothetical protein
MAKFVTIAYGDQDGYDRTDPPIRAAAHAHDARLRATQSGDMGMAGAPVQVRNHAGAGVEVQEGPFMRATLPVAGFAVLEADTLEEAVELAAHSPCAVAYGVIEVWPLHTG